MAESIRDAAPTIRGVGAAGGMMARAKNSILVRSVQADQVLRACSGPSS